ncbi:MAG: hypothetical protein R3Y35_12065 [Clostridia bacterium]
MSENNKRYKQKNVFFTKNKKLLVSLLCMALIVTTTVFVTLAYQTATTTKIVNEFETPEIETEIIEEFDGISKEDVTVTNSADSDVDVYVRLKFVVSTMEAVYEEDGSLATYIGDDGNKYYETGDIVATPSSFDEYGYLANHTTTIINVFDVEGLNTTDWMLDPIGDGVYYYKYSLAPGESAYDLVSSIYQTVYYDGVIVVLTIISDSVQVESGVEVWTDVAQSEYIDANGNPILYLKDDDTTVPTDNYTNYTQRFDSNYEDTSGKYLDGTDLVPTHK